MATNQEETATRLTTEQKQWFNRANESIVKLVQKKKEDAMASELAYVQKCLLELDSRLRKIEKKKPNIFARFINYFKR